MEFLFLDLDDTILDFHKAEAIALSKTIGEFGLEPTEEVLHRYHEINIAHWQMLERGEISREEVQTNRFFVLFSEFSRQVDAKRCARCYEHHLSQGHYFLPGAEEAVKTLHKKYRLFLASNGTAVVQQGRLTSAGLYPYFEQVFISQDIGFNKPAKEYFDACFQKIEGFDKAKAILVGDSLTSDILGGINAGLPTVWVNPSHKKSETVKPDYEIEALSQLDALLDTINERTMNDGTV